MNEVIRAMEGRRSIRAYTDEVPSKEQVEAVVEAGLWAARGEISFPVVMLLTVAAGLTGSWALYLLGRYGGGKVLGFYFKKFPKHQPVIEEKMEFLRRKGCAGVFVSKLLPMVRTLISIPAGMVKMNFTKYTFSSLGGIFLWNLAFVGAGYFFGDAAVGFFA